MKFNVAKFERIGTIIILVIMIGWTGFMAGFYEGTGTVPWISVGQSQVALPPQELTVVTTAEVTDTINVLSDRTYGEGYNCVDYAWEAMRLLRWKGQESYIVRLELDPGPDHAILLVPTEDKGWVFIEPQGGYEVTPTVGARYSNLATITGIYVMAIVWRDYDTYVSQWIIATPRETNEG